MKTYELVKYKYGKGGKYTAFCLTPAVEPKSITMGGNTFTVTNEGSNSRQARHFQRPETAQAWLVSTGASVRNPDWSVLQGTGTW